jgi:hypothetical protein
MQELKTYARIKYGIHTDLPVGEGSLFKVNWAWLLYWIYLKDLTTQIVNFLYGLVHIHNQRLHKQF